MVLAATGARPTALLLPLGTLAEHNLRATFAVNLLASGGIEAVNPGPLDAAGVAAAVAAAHDAMLARVRAAAARALAVVGDTEHVDALEELLEDVDPAVRRTAGRAVERLRSRLDLT